MEPAVAGDTRRAGLESLRPAAVRPAAVRPAAVRPAASVRTAASGRSGGYGPSQKTSPLAITSLVLGIVGIPCCTVFALGIAAVVTGFLARKQIAESQGFLKGDGMAMAGLVLGVISIVVAVVVWILNLTGATDSSFYFDTNA